MCLKSFTGVRKIILTGGSIMEKFSRIKIKPLQVCGLSAVLALGFGASSVNAQSGEEIDEIIVTATKREERLRDVPMSISVLGEIPSNRKGFLIWDRSPVLFLGLRMPSLQVT